MNVDPLLNDSRVTGNLPAESPRPPHAADPEALAIDSLVDQTRAGDDRAFSQLVKRMQPTVHRWALAYSGDGDEADDLVQEVFVLALRRLSKYRGDAAFHRWLQRITVRAPETTLQTIPEILQRFGKDLMAACRQP